MHKYKKTFAWFFASVLFFVGVPLASAQPAPQPPRLEIAGRPEQPVTLKSVRINTDIRGSLAVTSVEMTFANPNARQLEGELQFPLLDGQRVVGMAMDVDGALREAVPVEKARGQEVFEEITRARIDPALIEQTQGNNYKLRVFPILPRSAKTVVVRYLETLERKGAQHVYRLPLEYASALDAFELTVTVADKPTRQRGTAALGALAFERTGRFYTGRFNRTQFAAEGMLELEVPGADRPRSYSQVRDGKTYFYAEVPAAAHSAPRPLPRSVTLLWDASASGARRHLQKELFVLDAYFRKARNVDVNLVRFRDTAEPAQSFSVRNGNWEALGRELQRTVYDGATNFAAVALPKGQEVLLFSDGLGNYGGTDLPPSSVPVYAVSSATSRNGAWLAHVAERSGGRYVDLDLQDVRDAAAQLLSTTTRVTAAGVSDGSPAILASAYPENGLIRVAGMLAGSRGGLQLAVRDPDGSVRKIALNVGDAPDASDSPFAAQVYAGLQIGRLEGDYRNNRAEILRLGKTFGVVTRETSLIILDRVADYVRFEIAPPAELRTAYDRLLADTRQLNAAARSVQLERVVKLFAERQAWWAREFSKDTPPPRPAPPRPVGASPAARTPARERDDSARRESAAPPARVAAVPAAAPRSAPAPIAADSAATPDIGIQLRRWTPDAPYIARFSEATGDDVYRVYLAERASYPGSTAFYLDAADQLIEKGRRELGLRVLSNLAEMDLENRHVLRVLGQRLLEAGAPKLAIPVFRQVLELSPEEPQSYRDLGLAYAADKQYQKAIDALYEVVIRKWHDRFPEIETVALTELNAIAAEAERAGTKLDLSRVDPRLVRNLPLDTRVVLTWDADSTDIDLWVTDPNGEKCYFNNRHTHQGGLMSRDFTGGYGPEEFSLKSAKPGRYTVQVQFYGHNRTTVAGATTLHVKLYSRYGTAQQQERMITLRLRERKDSLVVGEFDVAAPTVR
jgi:tetratricopeptide (TPR) repeat protein